METREDYYEDGYWRGKSIADTMPDDGNGMFFDPEGRLLDYDTAVEFCHEVEEHDRQYTPFEFTARDINSSINPDDFWESFDNGITAGITETLTEKRTIE